MLGLKNFRCARILLGGIEIMHTIKKGQMKSAEKTVFLVPSSSTRLPT
ncbi:hypothetical protein OKW42_007152 [Paraburkholderia sp. WC7.3d]